MISFLYQEEGQGKEKDPGKCTGRFLTFSDSISLFESTLKLYFSSEARAYSYGDTARVQTKR